MNSDRVKKGIDRAAQRSLLKALGLRDRDILKPWIGVASAWSEVVPGHAHLDRVASAVKAGILAEGGTPFEFGVIGVCDGLAMGHEGMRYSLPSRELVADSLESHDPIPRLRRVGPRDQLRQDHAGDAHGRGEIGRPGDPRERRADARRKGRGTPGQRLERLRSRGRGRERPDVGCRAQGIRGPGLSRLRLVRRPVHGQQHELPGRGARDGPAGERNHPRRRRETPASGATGGLGHHVDGAERRPAGSYPDGAGLPQRARRGYGARREHEQPPPPARLGPGGRAPARPGSRGRGQRKNASSLQAQPRRLSPPGRSRRGRRDPGA